MARQKFPIVLSAPSGTGKTTLAHLLIDSMKDLKISTSHTTRPPRGNEEDGLDYFFIEKNEFDKMVADNEFVESAFVHGHYYGSSASWTKRTLNEGFDVLFDIDVQGGLQIKKSFPEAILIFILPPSMEELEARLTDRGTDSPAGIKKRIKAARDEINIGIEKYDIVINNEKLDRALFDLTAIVRTKRLQGIDRVKIRKRLLSK